MKKILIKYKYFIPVVGSLLFTYDTLFANKLSHDEYCDKLGITLVYYSYCVNILFFLVVLKYFS